MNREKELPMLAGIAAALRWLEELANIAAGPLLTVGLGIALVDLLTDGRLLASVPALLYAWAISQAVGVDAQLVGSAAKAAAAVRARRPWIVAGYLALVAVLAYVGYVASLVFATQEAAGITTGAALARLGMDTTSWLWQRSALAVLLVVLSGFLRYVPPAASAQARAEDERAKLARELELEPLRAELRARRALGWRDVGRSIIQGNTTGPALALPTHALASAGVSVTADPSIEPSPPPAPTQAPSEASDDALPAALVTPPKPPTGGGTPAASKRKGSKRRTGGQSKRGAAAAVLQLVPEGEADPERRIRALLAAKPGLSVRQISDRALVSSGTASKWRRVIRAEQERGQQLAQ